MLKLTQDQHIALQDIHGHVPTTLSAALEKLDHEINEARAALANATGPMTTQVAQRDLAELEAARAGIVESNTPQKIRPAEITLESLLATRTKDRAFLEFVASDRAILGWPERGMFIRRTSTGDLIGEAFCGATFFSAVRPPYWVHDGATHRDYGRAIVVPVTPEMIEKEKQDLDARIRRLKAAIEGEAQTKGGENATR